MGLSCEVAGLLNSCEQWRSSKGFPRGRSDMNPRYRNASALLSGVFTAVLSAMRAMPLRARPQHLRLAGALVLALWLLLALLGAAARTQAAPIGRGNAPF